MQFQMTLPNLKDKKTATRSTSKQKEGTPNHHIHKLHPTIWEKMCMHTLAPKEKSKNVKTFPIFKYFQQSK